MPTPCRTSAPVTIIEMAAAAPGAVVFVHCGVLTVGIRKKLGLPSRFDLRYSNPVDLHAIALRYPEVPFVDPAFRRGLFSRGADGRRPLPERLSRYVQQQQLDQVPGRAFRLRQVFERALAVVGPERLLFGTDSLISPRAGTPPFSWSRRRRSVASASRRTTRTRIFGGNLRRLLGLPEKVGRRPAL